MNDKPQFGVIWDYLQGKGPVLVTLLAILVFWGIPFGLAALQYRHFALSQWTAFNIGDPFGVGPIFGWFAYQLGRSRGTHPIGMQFGGFGFHHAHLNFNVRGFDLGTIPAYHFYLTHGWRQASFIVGVAFFLLIFYAERTQPGGYKAYFDKVWSVAHNILLVTGIALAMMAIIPSILSDRPLWTKLIVIIPVLIYFNRLRVDADRKKNHTRPIPGCKY